MFTGIIEELGRVASVERRGEGVRISSFETVLSVAAEDINSMRNGFGAVEWDEFLLNPRRLRGSDFLMRWSQGVWSEERIMQGVNNLQNYFALPYGPSGVAPDDDPRAFELYFERLDAANPESLKRPDLLIFKRSDENRIRRAVDQLGGNQELPFISENDVRMREMLAQAVLAVECENSLWRARRMPDYSKPLKKVRWLNNKMGLPKKAVTPRIWIKDQDRQRLLDWQKQTGVKIHVWQVFIDLAFGISLDKSEQLIDEGLILPDKQTYQAPNGTTQDKSVFKIYYHYAYKLGEAHDEPQLISDFIEDKNGHIMPFVRFSGGSLKIDKETIAVLDQAAGK